MKIYYTTKNEEIKSMGGLDQTHIKQMKQLPKRVYESVCNKHFSYCLLLNWKSVVVLEEF